MVDTPGSDPARARDNETEDGRVAALVRLGVAPETAADYVRRGDSVGAIFDFVLLPVRLERTVTPRVIESSGGMPVEQIAELVEAFGLPRPEPDEPAFTREEAQVLVRFAELEDVWPPHLRVQVARASGALLAGIARAEVQAFLAYTEPHVRARSADEAAELGAVQSAVQQLLPLVDPLLTGVHRRWLEHDLAQRAVGAAEHRAGADGLPGTVEVTFLFCDIKDFTAYASTAGDAAAVAAIDRFFEVVACERGTGGQFVKSLGDGAMLTYDNCAEAVRAGACIIRAMSSQAGPRVHASVHRGTAVARSGDYFGRSVNLAARLLAFAERDELVATTQVVEPCGEAFAWTRAGEHAVRGVGAPLVLYKLESIAKEAQQATPRA